MSRFPALSFTRSRAVGFALLFIGLGLITASAGFFVYANRARSDLDDLVARAPSRVIEEPRDLLPPLQENEGVYPATFSIDQAVAPAEGSRVGPASPSGDGEFQWSDWTRLPTTLGEAPRATRLVIPSIGLDTAIVEVAVVIDGGKRVWQRPKNSVGRHIGTANPGELGNVVMSGHISSPIRGEGSVFRRLPEIAPLLQGGQSVEAFVYTSERTYVYRLFATDVVKPEDVSVFDPTVRPTLTLITCVPDRVYSHRLVVSGVLVKETDGGAPAVPQAVEGRVVAPAA